MNIERQLNTIQELVLEIQDEVDLIGIARKILDSCMTGVGIESGLVLLTENPNSNSLQLKFSRGIRNLRKINHEKCIINLANNIETQNFSNDLGSFLKSVEIPNNNFREILTSLNYAISISHEQKNLGCIFLGKVIKKEEIISEDIKLIQSLVKTFSMSLQIYYQIRNIKQKYSEIESLKDAVRELSETLNLEVLSKKVYTNIKGFIYPDGGCLLYSDVLHPKFFRCIKKEGSIIDRGAVTEEIEISESLINYFFSQYDNSEYVIDFSSLNASIKSTFASSIRFINWDKIKYIIPLIVDDKLINIYFFGKSLNSGGTSEYNLNILISFLHQAKASFKNAFLFQREEYLRSKFQKYVPKQIVEDAINGVDSIGEGFEKEIVILFSDIRGFTTLCENKSPNEIVALLNKYFDLMLDSIEESGGVLDKLIGDAIMATWGIFDSNNNTLSNAASAALDMVIKLKNFNNKSESKDGISIGIGLHHGNVKVGNIGGRNRSDFTIIGDSVNLASRLEGVTKQYSVDIVVSEDFYYPIKDKFVFRELDTIKVKGKNNPIKIYQLVGKI